MELELKPSYNYKLFVKIIVAIFVIAGLVYTYKMVKALEYNVFVDLTLIILSAVGLSFLLIVLILYQITKNNVCTIDNHHLIYVGRNILGRVSKTELNLDEISKIQKYSVVVPTGRSVMVVTSFSFYSKDNKKTGVPIENLGKNINVLFDYIKKNYPGIEMKL